MIASAARRPPAPTQGVDHVKGTTYDPYGRPLTCPLCPPRRMSRVRELCGRGDMNDDTRMTTTPDDSRFSAAKDGILDSPLRPKDAGSRCDPSRRATGRRVKEDPRADLDDDGDVDGDDVTAYHNKKPTWSSVMSAPTVSQAFSDFDNPYMFQGVPHFAIDTAANATSEQLNLALNHHRARFADVQVGRWTTRDPLFANSPCLAAFPRFDQQALSHHIVPTLTYYAAQLPVLDLDQALVFEWQHPLFEYLQSNSIRTRDPLGLTPVSGNCTSTTITSPILPCNECVTLRNRVHPGGSILSVGPCTPVVAGDPTSGCRYTVVRCNAGACDATCFACGANLTTGSCGCVFNATACCE